MSRRRELAFAWGPALAYMGLIFAASSFAVRAPIDLFPLRDKGVHLVEYGILGFLCAHAAIRTWPGRAAVRTAAVGALLAFAWGISDELHQALVPGRTADALDLFADGVGGLAGAALRWVVHRFGTRRRASLVPSCPAEQTQP